ncbi:hypothetical protein RvY_00424 [Ramazzottius varieornatus]|uniref:Gamma-secretase subunit PEN-2 n=1 Tax=Ramazzottius varieornatus TaxID=947166 RepID=A0A1D1UCQ5_RAMVA|nr:hypothetical protein RvY_00424 [Ramazzottius varieornatus]
MASRKLKTAGQVNKELMVEAAIKAVKERGLSENAAAVEFGVCRMTMRRRIENPNPEPHGITKTSFEDHKFFSRFLSRHKELSMRITHATNRKKDREWTTERCEEYIQKLQKLKDGGFLERPEQVWNLDETAFNTARMYNRVVARRGVKQIPSQFDGNEKECVTILPCGNAAGVQLKLLALYAGKVHVQSRLDGTFDMIYHAVNSSGYMDQILFANYIKKEVLPAITELLTVIFVDGHFSHVNNLLLVRYCQDFFKDTGKRVEIFCLPVGQTNHLQPFDVSAFGGIKKKWHSYSRNALAGGMLNTGEQKGTPRMDISRKTDAFKANLCRKYFIGGFAFLPFLWLVNVIWFFKDAFLKDTPTNMEVQRIRGYVIKSLVGCCIWTAALAAWIVVFQTHRVEWDELGDRLSFIIPLGMS